METTQQAGISAQQQLVTDIKTVIADAEEVLSATADQASEKMTQLRARVQTRLHDAKLRLLDAEDLLIAKSKAAARATDDYVHDSPWAAVGIAAAAGLVVGVLIGRR